MPPKKAKKISLNEFLGDNSLGSWADEMDSLPSAPAVRSEEDQARGNDRFGRRGDDFLSTRPDRQGPPREDLPLPTQPPYTAFIGNLAFDLTEQELEDFFGSSKTKSVKIIKDREEKPKGFGYIEFEDLDGLKGALAKSGSNFSGRTIRVSVAEPPKERPAFSGGGYEDDSKFDNPWRRDGPLPPSADSRDSSRRRFDGPSDRGLPSVSEGPSDWRSSRPPARTTIDTDSSSYRRKGSGFSTPAEPSSADRDEVWAIGSKFKPAPPSEDTGSSSRFGSMRGRADAKEDESDWRSARPKPVSRDSVSPNSSTPPTPQLSRRKLELLPRSGNASSAPSPLSSPKMGPTPPVSGGASRSSPFGAAKPVDVTGREKEVTDKVEKEREIMKEKLSISPKLAPAAAPKPAPSTAPTVRPSLSFASAAAKKENVPEKKAEGGSKDVDTEVGRVAEVISEVTI
ncbi:Translation initiation factor 4B [Mycena sanguinolenta]|uniref:Translation initiation factor 4B n=1 Tax=Mycena sanguinolenta TaxID=230812 RepID=A0A8H7DGZ9_9AGAR|nr:Translation initiation factor 4B [Mycena sanguinolenta]